MSILIFLVVLIVLILVHELGHFLVAKISGIRVDEFGLGFPPRMFGFKKGETVYSINWIPFGGFVKIFGENPDQESISGSDSTRSMVNKPKWIQAAVLVAGVTFNVIFAWLLISIGFLTGLPASVDSYPDGSVKDAKVVITTVQPQSPAENAKLKTGDALVSLSSGKDTLTTQNITEIQDFITSHGNVPLAITYVRSGVTNTATATPISGLIEGRPALGIGMDKIGTLQLPLHKALWQGAVFTWTLTQNVATGLFTFLKNIFIFKADFSQVTGPVGIVNLVGDASQLGFMYLLSFTAFISINLAVINLLPFPALDGGRLLFVLLEKIKGSRIDPKFTNTVNAVGFALLLLLMLVITAHDVIKIFF